MPRKKSIAGNIKELRKKRQMTSTELIERSGVTSIRAIEAGRNPSVTSLIAIAEALGVSAARLLRGV